MDIYIYIDRAQLWGTNGTTALVVFTWPSHNIFAQQIVRRSRVAISMPEAGWYTDENWGLGGDNPNQLISPSFPQSDGHRIGWWEKLQESLIFDGKNHGFL